MSSAPAVPPLPHDFNQQPQQHSKPPIPPLPPNFHPEPALAAPTPERILPTLPADMARSLDESLGYNGPPSRSSSLYPTTPGYPSSGDPYRRVSPAPPPPPLPPGAGYPGGFARPASSYGYASPPPPPPPRTGPSPAPYPPRHSAPYPYPPARTGYPSPPPPQAPYSPQQSPYNLPNAMAGLNVLSHPPPRASSAQPYPHQHHHQQPSYSLPQSPATHHSLPTSPNPQQQQQQQQRGAPELTSPLPTLESLLAAQRALPPQPGPEHVPWIRDVLFLVDRTVAQSSGGTPPEGAVSLAEPALTRLAHDAIAVLLALIAASPSSPPPPHIAEALYLRGTLYSTGAFPEQIVKSPREAFKDFETAARAGCQKAWFKLGRDYEAVGDIQRAKDCFERGLRGGVESCYYRMGMAHLLGQLTLPAAPPEALPLLHRAATLASTDVPQPAYVYGLLLLGEFSHVRIEERLFSSLGLVPAGSTPLLEARKFVERAAFLGFAPAQYKLGHAYEYAVPPFPFDPLLSVQYYSLASQQGEPEADMALSKWFLCGAEGAFEKDEGLALTFADKAARTGLGSAEFAMGYYAEVGVGGHKDVAAARKWYAKAVEHGNADAPERLAALSQPEPQALSRTEHNQITDAKLVRKHTQARMSAAAAGRHAEPAHGAGVVGGIRQAHQQQAFPSMEGQAAPTQAHAHAHAAPTSHGPGYSLSDAPPAPAPAIGTPPAGGGRVAGRPPGRRREGQGDPHAGSGSPAMQMQSPAVPPNGHPGGMAPPPKKQASGAATFAEMGFQTGKAEDKDCVVM